MKTQLSPTLWRTCRVLAGKRRIRLLALVYQHPRRRVTDLANMAELSVPATSADLRRLQARGLIMAERSGRETYYLFEPDPQVADAIRLVPTLKRLKTWEDVFWLATALTHYRRIQIVRALKQRPLSRQALRIATGIPVKALDRHLQKLRRRGFVCHRKGCYRLARPKHPLAGTLLSLATHTTP